MNKKGNMFKWIWKNIWWILGGLLISIYLLGLILIVIQGVNDRQNIVERDLECFKNKSDTLTNFTLFCVEQMNDLGTCDEMAKNLYCKKFERKDR